MCVAVLCGVVGVCMRVVGDTVWVSYGGAAANLALSREAAVNQASAPFRPLLQCTSLSGAAH